MKIILKKTQNNIAAFLFFLFFLSLALLPFWIFHGDTEYFKLKVAFGIIFGICSLFMFGEILTPSTTLLYIENSCLKFRLKTRKRIKSQRDVPLDDITGIIREISSLQVGSRSHRHIDLFLELSNGEKKTFPNYIDVDFKSDQILEALKSEIPNLNIVEIKK